MVAIGPRYVSAGALAGQLSSPKVGAETALAILLYTKTPLFHHCGRLLSYRDFLLNTY